MRSPDEMRRMALDRLATENLTTGVPAASQPAAPSTRFAHWRWHIDVDGIGWALADRQDASTNTISEPVLREFDELLALFEGLAPKGLVIRSLKPNGFFAGAEIGDFRHMTEEAAIRDRITEALDVLYRLERFPAPTVALIHGFCLGGGLELALACRYRIARDDAKLGFPEVMLGLHPGLGGTWRSLRVADPIAAMPAMLTGRMLSARRAKRIGLVDAAIPERHFAAAVRDAVAGRLTVRRPGVKARLMRTAPARAATAWQMRKRTAERVRQAHYPAPFALIDLWQRHGGSDGAMRRAETPSFARLLAGETAQNLVRVFFLRERLKDHAKAAECRIRHVHVIGAGTMGGDIAAWCAAHGLTASVQDREARFIAPAIARARALFDRRFDRPGDARAALDRLVPDPAGHGIARADLVIEAVPEVVEIKAAVFADAEARMRADAILATNTSSILLDRLADGLARPDRFVGIHFFNPVARLPLVEVVRHDRLDGAVLDQAMAFAGAIDKLPLPVQSAPGFLVNRALAPYLLEAFTCLREGRPAEEIDAAAEAFGMPMGPLELADQVGLDVCRDVVAVIGPELGIDSPETAEWLARKVDQGETGKKAGRGIYAWRGGKAQKAARPAAPAADLQDRLILPLVNAAVACLRQGIVDDAEDVDAGLVFGTGFAPFRGGPLHYATNRGVDEVVARLNELAARHGDRLAPDDGWRSLPGNTREG